MQIVYVILCVAGTALPLAQFLPWLSDEGLNVPLFVDQALANPIAAFAWSDLAISAIVVVAFVLVESARLGMRFAWLSLVGLAVGVSLALPLFLLLRERHRKAKPGGGRSANATATADPGSTGVDAMKRAVPAVVLAAGLGLAMVTSAEAQGPNTTSGYWLTADRSAIVHITPCRQTLCGALVWLRDGDGALDERNPDPTKRAAPVCGLNILTGSRSGEAGRWTGGSIYDPEAGGLINGVALSARGDALTLAVGRGVFAGWETWRRVPAPAQPCRGR